MTTVGGHFTGSMRGRLGGGSADRDRELAARALETLELELQSLPARRLGELVLLARELAQRAV